ncbi:hypothetical protein [Photobacterium aquae]|uniref:hypothetical protein n=1 Tax=Photobacterium aquae TaxID=1195763 RepID=UPI000AD0C472|nr:hypothetical protein [Photobacterium aquae]
MLGLLGVVVVNVLLALACFLCVGLWGLGVPGVINYQSLYFWLWLSAGMILGCYFLFSLSLSWCGISALFAANDGQSLSVSELYIRTVVGLGVFVVLEAIVYKMIKVFTS